MQRRFWNWRDDDLTLDISQWLIGLIDSGRYRGFDADLDNSMTLKLNHSETGAIRVDGTGQYTSKYGVLSTKQGVIIQEYDQLNLPIDPTPAGKHRIDVIICSHTYIEVQGGEQAIYSVIKGDEVDIAVTPTAPLLTSEELQTIIGTLYLPQNTTSLNNQGVLYTQADQPNFANHNEFIETENGFFITDLDARNNRIINLQDPINSQDAATKFYVDQAILNNIVFATESQRGIAKLVSLFDNDQAISYAEGNFSSPVDHTKILTLFRFLNMYFRLAASQSEANSNTDNIHFITPKTLFNRFATELRKGVARIATEAEAIAGQDDSTIITPFKLKKALPLIPKVIEIGNWAISGAAPYSITIPHTLSSLWDKVVSTDVLIIVDDNSLRYKPEIKSITIGTNDVTVTLDSIVGDVDSSGVNRGFITFWLKEDLPDVQNILNVNAGPDANYNESFNQGQQSTTIDLNGFVEAIGSPIDDITWSVITQPSGANATFLQQGEDVTVAIDTYGSYTFRLTATNDDGDSAFDEVTIQITQQTNQPPVINFILGQTETTEDPSYNPGGPIPLGGWQKASIGISATDPDGDPLTYQIVQVDSYDSVNETFGPDTTNSTVVFEPNPSNPQNITIRGMYHSNPNTPGNMYHFKVIVDDGNGGQDETYYGVEAVDDSGGQQTPTFSMQFASDNNALSNVYDGSLVISGIAQVSQLKVTVFSTGQTQQNLDAIARIGNVNNNPQFVGYGTHNVASQHVSSNIPVRFEYNNPNSGQGSQAASITFRAYDSNNNEIGSVTRQVFDA